MLIGRPADLFVASQADFFYTQHGTSWRESAEASGAFRPTGSASDPTGTPRGGDDIFRRVSKLQARYQSTVRMTSVASLLPWNDTDYYPVHWNRE